MRQRIQNGCFSGTDSYGFGEEALMAKTLGYLLRSMDVIFLGLNLRNKRIVDGENQDLGMGALGYGGINVDQEVEVVAVHRKGSSGGGGGNVFMEFEFFPGKDDVEALLPGLHGLNRYPDEKDGGNDGAEPVVSVASAAEDEDEPEYHDATDDRKDT
ncbi:hypothetical protein LOK49_Contig84G00001 [Camellia lanceoleosa]|nr:hypothetical protein LOK49_Contig84G00001 [Camellia lanceoleosa]